MREREIRKRERENYPVKSPKLRHCQTRSQNKELREYQRRASRLWTGPSLDTDREAGRGATRARKGQSWPERGILYQTVSRLPVANQDFLGFWTVDIHREGHRQRSPPQKRHKAQLRWARLLPPRKLSPWDHGGDKMHSQPGEAVLTKHLVA